MKSRRCSIHGINWPPTDEYKVCPICEEETRPMMNASPIPEDEAHSMASHAKFERYYLETRGIPSDFEGEFIPDLREIEEMERKFDEIAGPLD